MSDDTAYDRVLYPGNPFAETHPDHLATQASLYGMAPAPASRCRVLELGCGDGGNLIPMAYQLPGSEFVGVDLSQRAIDIGNDAIAGLGLKNVVLRPRNIMDISAGDGAFDYIIAHGVYSWVPQFVRDKMLSVFRENLAPQGVAYVSYNAFPGAHMRDLVRSILLFHVRANDDPLGRNAQSRQLLKFLAEASPDNQVYGFLLRDQWERVKDTPEQVFIHDDLNENSRAFFLYQVVEAAAQRGLQYVADASFDDGNEYRHSKHALGMLAQIPQGEFVVREQYLDFIDGRAFRRSLFCQHEAALQRPVTSGRLAGYYLSSTATAAAEFDPAAAGVIEFKTHKGERLATDHRLSKAALLLLERSWPRPIAFADLLEQARALMQPAAGAGTLSGDDVEAVTNVLFQAFRAGLVQLHREPPRLTTDIGERPLASLLARRQAERAPLVTNLMHGSVMLEDEVARRFLPLIDGSRSIEQLASDLGAAMASHRADAPSAKADAAAPEITREAVESHLRLLGRLGLLLA